jgi:hypothetical protein
MSDNNNTQATAPETAPATVTRKRNAALEARVALIDGQFDLPDTAIKSMKTIRASVAVCARNIADACYDAGEGKYDVGRAIAALDGLQQVKDTACVSIILPHAPKTN